MDISTDPAKRAEHALIKRERQIASIAAARAQKRTFGKERKSAQSEIDAYLAKNPEPRSYE